MKLYASQK